MPTLLCDIIPTDALAQAISAGHVKGTRHPSLPYTIYNYTQACQYDGAWSEVTLTCRGLVVRDDLVVMARPFAKFFNHDQHASLPAGPVEVSEKLDGSLGILIPDGQGSYLLATRGSFTSEQALHATAVFQQRYASSAFTPWPGVTYLFEIIYPAGRIVLDYQGLDDLVLLAAIDMATGRDVPLEQAGATWPGPVAARHDFESLADVLACGDRDGAEGFVVRFTESGQRVKVKHAEYVRLHRLVTGVSERRVWEALSSGVDVREWLEAVPDEFHEFVMRTRRDLLASLEAAREEVFVEHARLLAALPQGFARAEYAALTSKAPSWMRSMLFKCLDGQDFDALVWKRLRPAEHVPFFAYRDAG